MQKRIVSLLLYLTVFILLVGATVADDPYLVRIGEDRISLDEFRYNLKKNNYGQDSILTRESIDEYLELFINFKLKVLEAKKLGLDTTRSFRNEFKTYKDQLTETYLKDDSTIEYLARQAYERMKTEINASHILTRVQNFGDPSDTAQAFEKISLVYEQATNGKDFTQLAKEFSEDPSAITNGGNLGYFSSLQMVFPFENAAYNTKRGEVSPPFRSRFGYHILQVNDIRESAGSVQVAHIMLRYKPNASREDSSSVKERIHSLYDSLLSGSSWDTLCRNYSEDMNTRNDGGLLRPFSSGMVVPTFSEAAFSLKENGDITEPVETPYGWHLIKLVNKIPLGSYEELQAEITGKVKNDSRSELSHTRLISYLKKENNFILDEEVKGECIAYADSSLIAGTWKYDSANPVLNRVLYSVGDTSFLVKSFFDHVITVQKVNRVAAPGIYMNELMESYIEENLVQYEKDHLSDKYYDYKMLVQEYREGILLFDLMDKKVWNRAVQDSVGLEMFYEANKNRYMWGPRLEASIFSSNDPGQIQEVRARLNEDPFMVKVEELIFNPNRRLTSRYDSMLNVDSLMQVLSQDTSVFFAVEYPPSDTLKDWLNHWLVQANVDQDRVEYEESNGGGRILITSSSKKYLDQELKRNSDLNLQVEYGKFENGDHEIIDMIDQKEGIQDLSIEDTEYLVFVHALLKPEPKALHETRGKAIADYQNELESEWIKELKSTFDVKVNRKALNQIYKEFEIH